MRTLVLVLFMASTTSCATSDPRTRSPHFRDGQFHNPNSQAKSFWSFLKMRVSTDYAQWPKWLESQPHKINPVRVSGGELHVSTINHSTVLLQTQGLNILTDPIFSERCSPVSWAGPKRVRNPGVRFEELPKIDMILISHDHYDHLDLPTIEKLVERDNPQIFVGLGVAQHFKFKANIVEMDWWESHSPRSDVKVHFVPVQHFSGRTLFDRNSTLWGGFVVKLPNRQIYFAGDTGYAGHFKETRERFGPMDVALIPIGAYQPRDFMGYAHVNPKEAVQAHLDLQAKVSFGVHYGTFQLTAEQIDDPVRELELALAELNVSRSQFLTPEFGKVVVLPP